MFSFFVRPGAVPPNPHPKHTHHAVLGLCPAPRAQVCGDAAAGAAAEERGALGFKGLGFFVLAARPPAASFCRLRCRASHLRPAGVQTLPASRFSNPPPFHSPHQVDADSLSVALADGAATLRDVLFDADALDGLLVRGGGGEWVGGVRFG